MTDNGHDGRPNVFPVLRYEDAGNAIGWLVDTFGFERLMVVPGENGLIEHAELKIGPGVVMVSSEKDDAYNLKSAKNMPSINQSVCVYIADVDAHYKRAQAAGADILTPLYDTSYGSREYSARDLERHVWTFGTYMPADSAP